MAVAAMPLPVPRGHSIVQRAYVYIVAFVSALMVIFGAANLLRVLAEMALNATSGPFMGLPFLFAEDQRIYREQASLAIALLVIGAPAWWFHYRMAQRAAASNEERGSALRSVYIHLMVFVTAFMLVAAGSETLSLLLQGLTFGDAEVLRRYGLEPDWLPRAAGNASVAVCAAVALAFHVRLSNADRRAVSVTGDAAMARHLALYTLVVIGALFTGAAASGILSDIWRRVADAFVALPGQYPRYPPGVEQMSAEDLLRLQIIRAVPMTVTSLVLWLGTWLPLQRGVTRGRDAAVERTSILRKLAIYVIVFVSAIVVLTGATATFAGIIQRLLGDPVVGVNTSLWHDLANPVTGVMVFGPMWLFHRRVVEGEAARESEAVRAATLRRLYTYLVAAIGLGMLAVGTAGALGVVGSVALGSSTPAQESAMHVSLVLVGAAAWLYQWRIIRRQLDDDERRSLPRRLFLYLAILAGVLGLLVFGAAGLYRVLNALLAFSFPSSVWHDVWHSAVNAVVAAAIAFWSFRALRVDRAVAKTSGAETYAVTVLVRASDREAAQARVASAIAGDADLTVKR